MGVRCSHCRHPALTDTAVSWRCKRCGLATSWSGEPFRPARCSRCESLSITWDESDKYNCVTCGRSAFGPYPLERNTRLVEPEGGWRRNGIGIVPGQAVT